MGERKHDHSSENHNHGGHQHHGMGQRGVTRPMEEMKHHGHGGHEHMEMNEEQRHHMLHIHHKQTLWIYWTLIILGFWMIASPLTFSYAKEAVAPSGGRDIWLSLGARVMTMTWSDIISGALLVFFGWRSLTPNRPVSLWICCFVGIWISVAPLLFWAPSAVAYLNATLVGVWVIALTVLIPGMPNMILFMKMGGDQPPGWSYNPSSWPQRWILIVLAFAGWLASRYLGAYQLGYIDHGWDPFFGEGTRRVLDSNMSHSWPISDASFGALAYTFEFLMGFMGATSRWRTMPWMVTFFGILVIPLGLVHIVLVISQPVLVGEWCTFCLLAAAIMLPMIPLTVDEVIAMGQHMRQSTRRGERFWTVFWKGGIPEGAVMDERTPELIDLPQKPAQVTAASIWGMTFPWTLVISAALGVWLMASPAVFGIQGRASDLFHVGGALAVVFAVVAMGEPVRIVRYLNLPLGLALAAMPVMLGAAGLFVLGNAAVAGLLLAALSLPRGTVKESFGTWDRLVR